MMKILPHLLAILSIFAVCPSVWSADIALSPDGPISTLEAARDAARKATKPVRIIVADGTYPRTGPLELGAEDADTTWEAAKGAKPVVFGGRVITGWEELGGGLWRVLLKDKDWNFEQLWINGRRAVRARTPNRGFFHLGGAVGNEVFADVKENPNYRTFRVDSKEYDLLRSIPESQRGDLLITVTNSWTVTQCRIGEMNDHYRAVKIRGKGASYPFAEREPDQRFWLENYRDALDEAGEWFLDREKGEVLYRPLAGETIEKSEFIAPVAEKFLLMKDVRNIAFHGIAFRYGQYLYPEDGLFDRQAAVGLGAAIEIEDGKNIRFENCEVGHVGEYGIHFKNGCSDSQVVKCWIHDLGGGGVRIGESTRPEESRVCRNIVVDNCILQHGGRLHPSACGVVLMTTQNCTVRQCDIGDFFYTGVSVGWTWGYGDSLSREALVENNHIHHLGWAYLSDMGGYYGVGVVPGTIIRGNHIHHVVAHRYGGWGLYTDEGSSDVLMENNLVHDTGNGGFHQHYGFFNTIRNNIFAFGGTSQIQRTRNEARLTIRYIGNIVVWDPPVPLLSGGEGTWKFFVDKGREDPRDNTVFRRNLYYRTDGKVPDTLTETFYTWEQWRKMGRDRDSAFADPLFENLATRDFRLKPGSPAEKMGFVPWDLSVAGVRKDDAAWVKLAAEGHDYPTWERDAKPWPSPEYRVDQTFEDVPPGIIGIRNANYKEESDPQSLGAGFAVSDEAASPIPFEGQKGPSQHSLKAQDKPDQAHAYDPVLDIHPKWDTSGSYHVAFDLMLREGAEGFFEMRGSGVFGAGPYVRWQRGKVIADVKKPVVLGDIAPEEWVRIEIEATTGAGFYTILLTRADGKKGESVQVPCEKSWDNVDYMLFSCLADKDTAYFIDNVIFESVPVKSASKTEK